MRGGVTDNSPANGIAGRSSFYRPEIDGLRCIAVVPVILFHAGFSPFPGGYIGVDVFFVISGYLITTLIFQERERGTFSLSGFYERRARRILPSLYFVLFCCMPFAWLWMAPAQYESFSKSLISVVTFVSNIWFWRDSGYFAAANEIKPLLHTWSLSVEEQYYALFPVFILLAWRLGRTRIGYLIGLIAVCSLLLSEYASHRFPTANFFLAPTRAWELLAGSLCAILMMNRSTSLRGNALSLAGLALIILPIPLYDSLTPWPSHLSLVPVAGTALVIIFGSGSTLTGRILSHPSLVWMGLISYSAYLWHQPLFAFARLASPTNAHNPFLFAALSAVSILLAHFTWKYVEVPMRKRHDRTAKSRRLVFVSAVLCSAGIVLAAAYGLITDGAAFRSRVPAETLATFSRPDRETECFDLYQVHLARDWGCDIGSIDTKGKYDFVVFGDSHALSLLEAFDSVARDQRLSGFFTGASGCIPLLDVYALRKDQEIRNCFMLNQRIKGFVEKERIPLLVLVARWTYYTDGGYDGRGLQPIGKSPSTELTREQSRSSFEYALDRTVRAYEELGTRLVFIKQVPQQEADPHTIYFHSYASREPANVISALSVSRHEHLRLQHYVNRNLDEVARDHHTAELIDFDQVFCDEHCAAGTASVSYYYDEDHLSTWGAKLAKPVIEELFVSTFRPGNDPSARSR